MTLVERYRELAQTVRQQRRASPFDVLVEPGLPVTELRVEHSQHAAAFCFDVAQAAVRADELQAQGQALGEWLALGLALGSVSVIFDFDGECCSESWLADVYTPEALLGQRVIAVETLALHEPLDGSPLPWVDGYPRALYDSARTRQEVDLLYGWDLRTAVGTCTLAVRNSSNGYYGGNVELSGLLAPGETHYNPPRFEPPVGWARIERDWSA